MPTDVRPIVDSHRVVAMGGSSVLTGYPPRQALLIVISYLAVLLCLAPGDVAFAQAPPAELLKPLPNNKLVGATREQSRRLAQIRRRPTTQSLNLVRVNLDALRKPLLRISVPGNGAIEFLKSGGDVRTALDFSWFGTQQPPLRGSATLIVRKGDVTGSVVTADGLYRISPIGGGVHAFVKADTRKFPPDEPPSFHPKQGPPGERSPVPGEGDRGSRASSSPPTQIDVLVAYTSAAKARVFDMDATIALAVAEANQAYVNSNINIYLNLVDSFEVSYRETGKTFETILYDFVGMADVNQRRDSSCADLSALIIDQQDYCGLADAILANPSTAFAIVDYTCATGYFSFAHELGHLMGARHNEQVDATPGYNHGLRHDGGGSDPSFVTIMSYDCPGGCQRLQYFSNPNLMYGPVPMGTTATNYNARELNATAPYVSSFRSCQNLAPLAPSRLLVDVDHDSRADYCRFVGDAPNIFLSCDLATASRV